MNVLMHYNGMYSEDSGVSSVALNQGRALRKKGVKLDFLFGYSKERKMSSYLDALSGALHFLYHTPLTALYFAGFIRGKKVDIVHSHTPEAAFDACIARFLLGRNYKIVVTLHGLDRAMRKEWKHEIKNGLARYSLKQELYLLFSMFKSWFAFELADEFISVSSKVAEQARLFYGIESIVIQNSVNCSSLKKIPKQKARKELGFGKEQTVLFVGNSSWVKGLGYLAEVVNKKPNSRLVVVGMQNDEETKLLLGNRVSFIGTIPKTKLGKYYSAADVLCVPSVYEAFGLMFAEAQCFGLPCIGCEETGAEETIENGKNGFLVKKRSVQEIVSALGKIKKLKSSKKKRGYSLKWAAEKISMVYNEVVE